MSCKMTFPENEGFSSGFWQVLKTCQKDMRITAGYKGDVKYDIKMSFFSEKVSKISENWHFPIVHICDFELKIT